MPVQHLLSIILVILALRSSIQESLQNECKSCRGYRSFIPHSKNSDFSIHNIPFGVYKHLEHPEIPPRCATRIGDYVIDLAYLEENHMILIQAEISNVFNYHNLNKFMSLGKATWTDVRRQIQKLFEHGSHEEHSILTDLEVGTCPYIFHISKVRMLLPARVGDYTDFYSSYNHAFNMGSMFRDPKNAVKPNWLWLPVGYHGRASSVVVSGRGIRMPRGQTFKKGDEAPTFGVSKKLDFELEVGTFIGTGNRLGQPIDIKNAEDHIFGLVLMNDWSARDIQGWEYVPLGPFTGKSLGTVISPWIVTMDALEPFRIKLPPPKKPFLDYLDDPNYSSFDIKLEAVLKMSRTDRSMNKNKEFPICKSNYKYLYWSMAQQVAHHTVTGCNLKSGDLFGSGKLKTIFHF